MITCPIPQIFFNFNNHRTLVYMSNKRLTRSKITVQYIYIYILYIYMEQNLILTKSIELLIVDRLMGASYR